MHLSVTAFRQWLSLPSNDHIIHFYPSDEALISNLCEYVSTGLEKGDATIVITKPIHIKKLCEAVGEYKTSSRELFRDHSIVLNATSVLEDIIVDGLPDWERFFSTVGSVIGQAAKSSKTIRTSFKLYIRHLNVFSSQDILYQIIQNFVRLLPFKD